MNKRFPPRAKKAAPIVQAGRENLQKSSDILHQHRLSLASQLRNFDNRWADLFSSTPVLNKLTKGRQKPEEFHTNAQNLLDDVQVALRDAHSRKQRKGREQDSIIPDPLPIPYSTRQGPRSISIFPIAEEEFEEEPDKKSMMQRVRSKLKRKKAIKKKGSRPGLSRFNPFKKRVTPGSDTITEVEPRKVKHKSSRRSVPSSSGSGSRSRSRHRSPRHKSSRRLREQPEPPVIPTEFKPYLPEPPMLPPMKLEMSSIGYYHPSSPSIASPPRPQRDYRYHLDPSVGPSSPQPYYLSVQNEQNSPRHRPRESSARGHSTRHKTSRDLKDDSHRRRDRSHRHRSDKDKERRHDSSDSRSRSHRHHRHHDRDYDSRRDSKLDDSPSYSHRHHDYDSRHDSKLNDSPSYSHRHHHSRDSRHHVPNQSASSYAHRHDNYRFWQPVQVTPSPERSRFKENFSIIHSP
ncbi:hypothetical protein WG66_007814 [Moniliophthora roreri]|nr:hypothetical protein WG66_007814 [Moniliophthora roreri]